MRKTVEQKIIKTIGTLAVVMATLILGGAGCATAPESHPPVCGQGPQLVVSPETVRLGVARLVSDTALVFRGSGFMPGDSLFISMRHKNHPEETPVAIADAEIDEEGRFVTEVEKLVKITEFLHADIGLNADMEKYIIIDEEPIAAGEYIITAQSMESERTARCTLTVKRPCLGDRLKDWMGRLLGKIEKR